MDYEVLGTLAYAFGLLLGAWFWLVWVPSTIRGLLAKFRKKEDVKQDE